MISTLMPLNLRQCSKDDVKAQYPKTNKKLTYTDFQPQFKTVVYSNNEIYVSCRTNIKLDFDVYHYETI